MIRTAVDIILAGVFAGLVLVAGHYGIAKLRQTKPPGERKLHPIAAYVYGCATVGGAFTVWALLAEPNAALAVLGWWIILVVAGAFDVACYLLDHWAETRCDQAELDVRRKADEAD
jgi:hypothetical protein